MTHLQTTTSDVRPVTTFVPRHIREALDANECIYGIPRSTQVNRIMQWFFDQGEAEQAAILGCNYGKTAFAQTTDLEGTVPAK